MYAVVRHVLNMTVFIHEVRESFSDLILHINTIFCGTFNSLLFSEMHTLSNQLPLVMIRNSQEKVIVVKIKVIK